MLKFKLSVVALSTMCGDFIFWLTRLSLTFGSMMFCLVTCNKIFLYDTAVQYLVRNPTNIVNNAKVCECVFVYVCYPYTLKQLDGFG